MDLLTAKNNYSPVVKESCLIWRNHSLQWLDRLGHFQTFMYPGKKFCQIWGWYSWVIALFTFKFKHNIIILFTYAKRKGIFWLDAIRVAVCWSLWSSSHCFVEASQFLKPPFHASVLCRWASVWNGAVVRRGSSWFKWPAQIYLSRFTLREELMDWLSLHSG